MKVNTIKEASVQMLIIFQQLIDDNILIDLPLSDISNLSENLVFNIFGRRRSNIPIRSLKTATSHQFLGNLIEESLGIVDIENPGMLEQDYSGKFHFCED